MTSDSTQYGPLRPIAGRNLILTLTIHDGGSAHRLLLQHRWQSAIGMSPRDLVPVRDRPVQHPHEEAGVLRPTLT